MFTIIDHSMDLCRWWRSAASWRGLAGEQTLTMKCPAILCPPSSQTLTTLDLRVNSGAGGAQHLGEALQVNQVRHWQWSVPLFYVPSSQTLTTLDLSGQQWWWRSAASWRGLAGEPSETLTMKCPAILCPPSSQTLTTLALWRNSDGGSVMEERSILARPCGWTKVRHWQWECPAILCSPSSQTLTTLDLWEQHDRWWRSAASWRGLAGEPSETLTMKCPAMLCLHHHRHSPHWIFRATGSVMEERSISGRPCGWTKWDTDNEVSRYSMFAIITDTHHTGSFEKQYRWWRSAASWRGLAGEPGETLTMSVPLFYVHHHHRHSPHWIFRATVIGDGGAQHLGEALQVNHVRHWQGIFADVLSPGSSQTLTTLDIGYNNIGAEGVQHLRDASRVNQVSCCDRKAPGIFFLIDDYRRSRSLKYSGVSRMGGWREESSVGFRRCAVTVSVLELLFRFLWSPLYQKVWTSRVLNKTCFLLYVG